MFLEQLLFVFCNLEIKFVNMTDVMSDQLGTTTVQLQNSLGCLRFQISLDLPLKFPGISGTIWNLRRQIEISALLGKFQMGNFRQFSVIFYWKYGLQDSFTVISAISAPIHQKTREIWRDGKLREISKRKHSIKSETTISG